MHTMILAPDSQEYVEMQGSPVLIEVSHSEKHLAILQDEKENY